jgi:hypothetical protein
MGKHFNNQEYKHENSKSKYNQGWADNGVSYNSITHSCIPINVLFCILNSDKLHLDRLYFQMTFCYFHKLTHLVNNIVFIGISHLSKFINLSIIMTSFCLFGCHHMAQRYFGSRNLTEFVILVTFDLEVMTVNTKVTGHATWTVQ